MMFPIGMQFLKAGEEYEMGVGEVRDQAYMIGDLERTVAGAKDGSKWKPANGVLEVVAGKRCRFAWRL
jgi:hypothetical protein